ncbi:hypothetical protein GCM10028807_45140 [Spirosoma daeguense]
MVFSHYYCVQQPRHAAPVIQQLLPNYEMLLVLNFGAEISFSLGDNQYVLQRTAVVGPLQNLLRYVVPPAADLIVVNFTLNGFYRLLGVPMNQFKATDWANADVLLDATGFEWLWQQIASIDGQEERLQRISQHIAANLSPVDEGAYSLLDSIPYFNQMQIDPVKALAERHQVSARRIQARFQTYLGYSAKELIRFLRFKKVINHLSQQTTDSIDWLAIVQEFGYHDHSHLIKDFQYFLGMTPRRFLRELMQGGVCVSKSGKFYGS